MSLWCILSNSILQYIGSCSHVKSFRKSGTNEIRVLHWPRKAWTAIFLFKTVRHNRTIQKSELKTKKQDRTIKESELKTNRHNRPIQKSELKTKKQDRTIKESELKTNRYNRPIQKSELGINRLHRPIQSEDRIGIGRSINRTFRPPLRTCQRQSLLCDQAKKQFLWEYSSSVHNFSMYWPNRIYFGGTLGNSGF